MVRALRRRACALPVLALAAVALAGACQPVDEAVPAAGAGAASAPPASPPGSQLPEHLPELLAGLESTAAEWQAGARVVEVVVDLEDDRWAAAAVTFLAPDADRFLLVRMDGEGTRQERPTLATLDIAPVPADALAQVPPWPEDALGPADLAAAAVAARDACGLGERVQRVLYATGAPAAWDGQTWTEAPAWTATLSGAERAVVVDPMTGGRVGEACLDA